MWTRYCLAILGVPDTVSADDTRPNSTVFGGALQFSISCKSHFALWEPPCGLACLLHVSSAPSAPYASPCSAPWRPTLPRLIRSATDTFEFTIDMALSTPITVEGIIRYHPFLIDHETYPNRPKVRSHDCIWI